MSGLFVPETRAAKPFPHSKTKPAAVNSISLISSIAMALGLAASLPQILRMLSARSAGGQSIVGWTMGGVTNVSMAYVNFFGFGAKALTASNLVSATLCAGAVLLIMRFREPAPAAVGACEDRFDEPALTIEIPVGFRAAERFEPHHGMIAGLPTGEFDALRDAVLTAEVTRRERSVHREPELAAAPVA